MPEHFVVDLPRDEAQTAALDKLLAGTPTTSPRSWSSRWCRAPAACIFHDATLLRRLRALADKYDVLLIFDEIFTGFGRTGTMFACERPA